jgi:hypothetical protein
MRWIDWWKSIWVSTKGVAFLSEIGYMQWTPWNYNCEHRALVSLVFHALQQPVLIIILQVFWCTHNYSLPLSPIFLLSACARFPSIHPSHQLQPLTIQSLFRSQQRSRHKERRGVISGMWEKCARCETRKIEKKKPRVWISQCTRIRPIQCKAQLC